MAKRKNKKDNVEKVSFRSKLNSMKLGSHHKIERFGIIFSILSLFLVVSLFGGFKEHLDVNSKKLTNVAINTASGSSSISKTQFTTEGVYRSMSGKKAYVLLKFTDPAAQTLNINDYRVFVSNVPGRNIEYSLSGNMFVFGATGYFGVELFSEKGFSNNPIDMIFRIEKGINKKEPELAPQTDRAVSESFDKYDQFEVIVNPGAKNAVIAPSLDSEDFDASAFYKQYIQLPQELEIKAELQENILEQKECYDKYKEYTRRLASYDVKVPKLCSYLRSDNFVLDEDDKEYNKKLYNTYKESTSVEKDEGSDGSLGSVMTYLKTPPYRLNTVKIIPGGYNYEWHNKSMMDSSYIDEALPKNMGPGDFEAYLNKKHEERETSDDYPMLIDGDDNAMDWTYTNGKKINFESGLEESSTIQNVLDETFNVMSTWQSTKITYQTELLEKLLVLEFNADAIDKTFSNIGDTNGVIVWAR